MRLSASITQNTIARRFFFGVCALVFLLCLFLQGCSTTSGQTEDSFKQAFISDKIAKEGVASNDYLTHSDYSVTAFKAENIRNAKDGQSVIADVTATIENDNYSSELIVSATYQAKGNNEGEYDFEVIDSTTTPKKGINSDPQNGIANANGILSEDGKSCAVMVDDVYDLWFAKSTVITTYNYIFDGNGWIFGSSEKRHDVAYKDIDGNYYGKTGTTKWFSKFAISDLTPNGSFDVDFATDSFTGGVGERTTYSDTSGSMDASIEINNGGKYLQADGYSYYFEAKGTSDKGDSKEAKIFGYFVSGESGEKEIELTAINISTNITWLGQTSSGYIQDGSGVLYHE